jgi:hypothetical protein
MSTQLKIATIALMVKGKACVEMKDWRGSPTAAAPVRTAEDAWAKIFALLKPFLCPCR